MPKSQLEETLRDATTQWEVFGVRKSATRPESPTKHSILQRHSGSNLEFVHSVAWRNGFGMPLEGFKNKVQGV